MIGILKFKAMEENENRNTIQSRNGGTDMKVKDLLSHFENERQWVDIVYPVLPRTKSTIAELSKDKQIMEMEFTKWRMTLIGTLEIDVQ